MESNEHLCELARRSVVGARSCWVWRGRRAGARVCTAVPPKQGEQTLNEHSIDCDIVRIVPPSSVVRRGLAVDPWCLPYSAAPTTAVGRVRVMANTNDHALRHALPCPCPKFATAGCPQLSGARDGVSARAPRPPTTSTSTVGRRCCSYYCRCSTIQVQQARRQCRATLRVRRPKFCFFRSDV